MQSGQRFQVGSRFYVLVKFKAGDAREQSFTRHIASQAQDDRIIFATGNVFRSRLEMELGHIDAAKQTTCEFGLINQLLAPFERQRRATILLRVWQSQQARYHRHKAGRLISEAKSEWPTDPHLK